MYIYKCLSDAAMVTELTFLLPHLGGGLLVKILKRTATFDDKDIHPGGPPPGQNHKLDVPKKTKLFIDQTLREREHGTGV